MFLSIKREVGQMYTYRYFNMCILLIYNAFYVSFKLSAHFMMKYWRKIVMRESGDIDTVSQSI